MALVAGERVVEGFVVDAAGRLAVVPYVNAASIVQETGGVPRDADGRIVVVST